MKWIIIVAIIIGVVLLVVLPQLHPPDQHVCGRIRIHSAGIYAEVYIADHGPDCGCCPSLWNGGKVTTTADMSSVQIWDVADLITLDGGHYVLECVEIKHTLSAFVKADGDVLVCVKTAFPLIVRAYRFVRL